MSADPADAPPPGAQLLAEIREQPAALRRLHEHDGESARAARAATAHGSGLVRMVGHGSSDNAASYGVYAFGLLPGWTAFRDSISLSVYYGAGIDVGRSTVVALSQSGQTPDVLGYVERARSGGALTLAVTNEPGSALASAAEVVLPLAAGSDLVRLSAAVQVEETNPRKNPHQLLPHQAERGVVEITAVGNEANQASARLLHVPLGQANELDVVVMQPSLPFA